MIQVQLGVQLFVWGYLICTCGTTNLDSDEVLDGKWVLKDRSSATLLCTISPFTGRLIWRFNYSIVAECTLKYCRQFSTGEGAFMFGFDTENGFFEFTINPVDMKKHNGKIIQCYDGTDTFNVTATVTESEVYQAATGNTSTHDGLLVAILVFDVISTCILGAGVIFVIWKFVCKKKPGDKPMLQDDGNALSLTDVHVQAINENCIQPLTTMLTNQHEEMMTAVMKLSKVTEDYFEEKKKTDEKLTSNVDEILGEMKELHNRLDSKDNKQDGSDDEDKSDGGPQRECSDDPNRI